MVNADAMTEVCSVKGVWPGDNPDFVPVTPADLADVEATLPYLPAELRPLFKLQLACTARAGELVTLRECEID